MRRIVVAMAVLLAACDGGKARPADGASSDTAWCQDYVKKNVDYVKTSTGFDTAVDGCLSLLRDGILRRDEAPAQP